MDAMILAAGRGQRMRPLTDTVPKPLLQVGSRPLIEHHLLALRDAGFRKVVINVSYLSEIIVNHLGSGSRFGVDIEFSEEPGGPYGTAAGIRHALHLIDSEKFLVISSDVYTRIGPRTLNPVDSPAHLAMVPNPPHNQGGDFRLHQGRLKLADPDSEESGLTYSGIGVYTRDIFNETALEEAELGAMVRKMLALDYLVTGELREDLWIDVGTRERLEQARCSVSSAE